MRSLAASLSALLALTPLVTANGGILSSRSLASCQTNSSFSAQLFDVLFTADDGILDFNITGTSTVQGNVTIDLAVYAYGLKAYTETINPCENSDLGGLCPMQAAPLNIKSNTQLPADSLKKIPGKFGRSASHGQVQGTGANMLRQELHTPYPISTRKFRCTSNS